MAVRTWYRMHEAADYLHISNQRVNAYVSQGKLKCERTPGGHKVFTKQQLDEFLGKETPTQEKRLAFYARDSKGDAQRINRQLEKLENAYGTPEKTYTDKASGLNENRKGLARLIKDAENHKFETVCVTAKDRLTRFGYTYIEHLLNNLDIDITVLDDEKQDKSTHDELLQDFMSLLTSFSGKYYKLRGPKQERMFLDKVEDELK